MSSPGVSVNTRHSQDKESCNIFVKGQPERPATVEVVCSSARRRMDHHASHDLYRLFSHTLSLDTEPVTTWPERTSIFCWHCCHGFETIPISIPRIMSTSKSHTYEVYGVFCSINCAKKFVLDRKGYDQSQVLLQLNEMCSEVFGLEAEAVYTAKPAPPRFFLHMFGGHMDIQAFRNLSLTAHTMLVMPPFVSHAMIMESHPTSSSSSMVIEPLREGQHMLRGLRRPTRPVSPPPCLLYTSPSPRDQRGSRMPSSA